MSILKDDAVYGTIQNDYYYLLSVYNYLAYYIWLYGVQFLLLTMLSTLTVFRRDLSCNREYIHDADDEGGDLVTRETTIDAKGYNELMILSEEINIGTAGSLLNLLGLQPHMKLPQTPNQQQFVSNRSQLTQRSRPSSSPNSPNFSQTLPPDTLLHLLTYLSVEDVISLSLTSRSIYALLNDSTDDERAPHSNNTNTPGQTLWRELLKRDYRHVLTWTVFQSSFRRCHPNHNKDDDDSTTAPLLTVTRTKTLYFQFALSWMDYALAGHNTATDCLVGLHGDVHDISNFLEHHPGSPETVLAFSGRDATNEFEIMGHSRTARDLARTFCVLKGGDGTRRRCLEKVRREYGRARDRTSARARLWGEGRDGIIGDVHVYFDVFDQGWRWWYTGVDNFGPVYINEVR
mmetsp:Transcript_58850/g.70192  ORF Transcript_58850/g.70192 Transcript_58850/m.70192 type:complete len:403 (+) Transcript_58850:154-1362(+)